MAAVQNLTQIAVMLPPPHFFFENTPSVQRQAENKQSGGSNVRNVKKTICRQVGALLSFTPVNTWSVTGESIDLMVFKNWKKWVKNSRPLFEMSERSFIVQTALLRERRAEKLLKLVVV